MPIPEKLGGFKVLKDVTRMSLASPDEAGDFPLRVFRSLADSAINIPYATCLLDGRVLGLNIVVETVDAIRASRALETASQRAWAMQPGKAILSIFPHRRKPEITQMLFEAFNREGIPTDALASSPSAISVVIDQDILNRAGDALFGPFTFGAYRTPEDWKLAQEGKEELFKEIVASYQEQRPKVYGLEYQDRQAFLQVKLDKGRVAAIGRLFDRLVRPGASFTFLAAAPCGETGQEQIAFCLPLSEDGPFEEAFREAIPSLVLSGLAPVAAFSMNGPHFGDRYGIVTELLTAFVDHRVDLLGLSCTIASITGVVPSSQLIQAVEAIRDRFDIPSVIERT